MCAHLHSASAGQQTVEGLLQSARLPRPSNTQRNCNTACHHRPLQRTPAVIARAQTPLGRRADIVILTGEPPWTRACMHPGNVQLRCHCAPQWSCRMRAAPAWPPCSPGTPPSAPPRSAPPLPPQHPAATKPCLGRITMSSAAIAFKSDTASTRRSYITGYMVAKAPPGGASRRAQDLRGKRCRQCWGLFSTTTHTPQSTHAAHVTQSQPCVSSERASAGAVHAAACLLMPRFLTSHARFKQFSNRAGLGQMGQSLRQGAHTRGMSSAASRALASCATFQLHISG